MTVTAAAVLRRRRGRPARPRRRTRSDPTACSATPTARRRTGSGCSCCWPPRAEQLGVTEGALELTSTYAKTREQFGRPIGTFQAVSQRLADGYIDVLGQRLTLWQAAWRLDEGLPADQAVAIAKLWAADAGHRLAHTTVHVHGGVGIDLDGEAHRYFTTAKRFEFAYGGATEQALHVGRLARPPNPRDDPPRAAPRPGRRRPARARLAATGPGPGPSTSPSPRPAPTPCASLLDPDRPPHVGVLLDNTPEMVMALSAAALGGHVVVGLNTTRRGESLLADIRTGDCQLVLTDDAHADLLDGLDLGDVRVVDVDDSDWLAGFETGASAPSSTSERAADVPTPTCSC